MWEWSRYKSIRPFLLQYEFNYNVKDADTGDNGIFFEKKEAINEETPNRTEGEYKVRYHQIWIYIYVYI